MSNDAIRAGIIVSGPFLPEAMEVLTVVPMGESLKIIGKGLQTGLARDPVLTPEQLSLLTISSEQLPFDGDARLFRLGIEAHRLGLAYEYDSYFSLSIARVDPLPHQLEAVYDYFLKLPRIRFLLADDPGAGKTIMAGLLRQLPDLRLKSHSRNRAHGIRAGRKLKKPEMACVILDLTTTSIKSEFEKVQGLIILSG